MYLQVGGQWFYLVDIIDGFSRYLVHWSINPTMTSDTVTLTIQEALDSLRSGTPENVKIVHDNGAQFASAEWKRFIQGAPITSIATRVRHPESNGVVERLRRTHREEGIGLSQPQSYYEAVECFKQWQIYYNTVRPHSAIKYFPPMVYYRRDPSMALRKREASLIRAAEERKVYWSGRNNDSYDSNSHLQRAAFV